MCMLKSVYPMQRVIRNLRGTHRNDKIDNLGFCGYEIVGTIGLRVKRNLLGNHLNDSDNLVINLTDERESPQEA